MKTDSFGCFSNELDVRPGAVALALALFGFLPEINYFLEFGNLTWATSYYLSNLWLGCVFSIFSVIALVVAICFFRNMVGVSIFVFLLGAGKVRMTWMELFGLPLSVPGFQERLYQLEHWTLVGFLKFVGFFVVVPVFIYISMRWLLSRRQWAVFL